MFTVYCHHHSHDHYYDYHRQQTRKCRHAGYDVSQKMDGNCVSYRLYYYTDCVQVVQVEIEQFCVRILFTVVVIGSLSEPMAKNHLFAISSFIHKKIRLIFAIFEDFQNYFHVATPLKF